jgi:hypothetical protein
MSGKDPIQPGGRWRLPLVVGVAAALTALASMMCVISPLRASAARDDLRAGIISDYYRLEHAAQDYVRDNGGFPGPAFDLSDSYDGGLRLRASAPPHQQATWKGPYLSAALARPTPQSFWSMAEPQVLQDSDHDGQADELWARLHRGNGEIDDDTAAWLDKVLDDGAADTGGVRVTPTWIWFKLLER